MIEVSESPWARAWRSFLSAIAADPVLLAVVVVLAQADVAEIRANLVPVALAVLAAAIVGAISFVGGFVEAWRRRVQTPLAKGVVQALEKFAVGLGLVHLTSLDPDVLYTTGEKLLGLAAAAILSGLLTFALNKAQDGRVIDVEPVPPAA